MAKGYGRPPMGRKGGKGMGMGMPGLNMDMIKQAQKMQADMERTQAELQEKEYTATAGGGVVSAKVAAMEDMSSSMGKITGGMNLPF